MVTSLKRITISLPDTVAEAVEALAKAQGRPQSKVIVSALEDFAPSMIHLAQYVEQMKAGQKEDAQKTVRHLVGDAMASLMLDQANSLGMGKK
jgi:predicted transcriptional regulator